MTFSKAVVQEVVIAFGVPLLPLWALSHSRRTILADAQRWLAVVGCNLSGLRGLAFLLGRFPEFRSLFYYRLGRSWKPLTWALQLIWSRCPALYLACPDIGPGLFIQHGFATIVAAERIGANCWINQQVTIGHSGARRPVIGDNVKIRAGAKVIGGVTVGDNAVVGAGAVVVKDVPPGCTVVGVPAHVVPPKDPGAGIGGILF